MVYTDEVLKLEVMRLLKYKESEAELLIESYKVKDKLNDLKSWVECKNNATY